MLKQRHRWIGGERFVTMRAVLTVGAHGESVAQPIVAASLEPTANRYDTRCWGCFGNVPRNRGLLVRLVTSWGDFRSASHREESCQRRIRDRIAELERRRACRDS